MSQRCKDIGKQLSIQYYSRADISAQEIRTPETVIAETFGFAGEILTPKVYSPKAQMGIYRIPRQITIKQILEGLEVAEKVARRQYDELLIFPEMAPFMVDLLYIRNDEHEHEKILECIIQRLGTSPAAAQPAAAQPTQLHKGDGDIVTSQKLLGEFYETILDRFGEEEEKSVNSYQELLAQVQQSREALKQSKLSGDAYGAVATPLMELERKINKHLNEERVHLDVIDTMQEMFTNMKLGNVY